MNVVFNKIVQGDCLEVMRQLPDNSIDLIITSPPYNLKNSTGNGMKDGRGGKWKNAELVNGYSHHNDCMPHKEYVQWQLSIYRSGTTVIAEKLNLGIEQYKLVV